MDPHARLRLGRRVQRTVKDMTKVSEMEAVAIREAIMAHVEDSESAGAFWTAVRPEDG